MNNKILEVKNLNYAYPDGSQALKSINLDIFEGEAVGIIGPNGAGKSTLLLHVNGILKGEGCIKIFGLEPGEGNLKTIRKKAGLVFQDPDDQLFMPTVFDDVAFGPINLDLDEGDVKKSANEALRKVGMLDFVDKSPHHLSVGEKRRVSIATVLSMKPEILLLDEPSSNLDPKSRRDLINFLKNFQITKIIAGHDLELILDICKRAILLDGGMIAADGDVKEILSDKSLMELHGLEVPSSLRESIECPKSA